VTKTTSELPSGFFTAAEERVAQALTRWVDRVAKGRLWDGSWFRRLVSQHLASRRGWANAVHWDQKYPGLSAEERATQHILRVARRASAAGALASLGASTGELLSLFSEGGGVLIGVPAALVSMLIEAGYTALQQVDLACDLASIYSVPFQTDDIGEVSTLFEVALDLPRTRRLPLVEEQEPVGLTERLMQLEAGDVGRLVGRKLFEDALIRNVIPIVNIPISARWNYVATRRLGSAVRRYVRYRRALREAFAALKLEALAEPEMLVEGAWLMATSDGPPDPEEIMGIAIMMEALPEESRQHAAADRAFGDDEEGWFDALALVPPTMHGPLMDVLYLMAGADRSLDAPERRFLQRVGRALSRPVDLERAQQICRHLASGEALPTGLAMSG
jgi:hypothetical protein